MRKFINNLYAQRYLIGVCFFIFFAFFVNTFHTQFPDEYDNIYGGFLINHGKLPYTGFFTHHNPGAYFLASTITLFTQRSFVNFRIVFAILLFAYFIFSYYLLKRRLKKSPNFYLFFGILVGIGATYWWGQMLLSETIVGFLLSTGIVLVVDKVMSGIKFDVTDLWVISLLTFLSIFTSLTYVYFVPIFDLIVLFYYFRDNFRFNTKKIIKALMIFLGPYIVFFGYLLLTGSLSEFYFASIKYNVNYYIYNFPQVAGQFSHNPIRYGISIALHTLDNFWALLTQITSFNLAYPFNISIAVGLVAVIIYFMIRKKYSLVILTLSMLFWTNARSEPLNMKETDFHATVFIMMTLSLITYFFFSVKDYFEKSMSFFNKLILSGVFLLTLFYWFFNSLFLFNRFADKVYGKYMGRDPRIYDMPQAAPILNKILTTDDYYWIGPFELQEVLFVNAKQASKYFWFLPANSRDEKIKKEITSDLTKNRPKVIVFKKWWANFGVRPEDFNTTIVDFLDRNYFQISDLRKEGMNIKVKAGRERDFDFESEFFFDKNRKAEIISNLIDKGLIEQI